MLGMLDYEFVRIHWNAKSFIAAQARFSRQALGDWFDHQRPFISLVLGESLWKPLPD
jgi:hypothetical protein